MFYLVAIEIIYLCVLDLIDSATVPTLSHPVFSTKCDQRKHASLPPSLLTISWSAMSSQHGESSNSVDVKIDRSCKLSCTPFLLRTIVELITNVSSAYQSGENETNSYVAPSEDNATSAASLDFKFNGGQVLLELCSLVEDGSELEADVGSPSPDEEEETIVSPQKDSILVSWESLSINTSNRGSPVGALDNLLWQYFANVSGLQLSSSGVQHTHVVVLPVELESSLTRHKPCSKLDR